jgi:alpha-1,6-mannosyltransferase
MRQTVAFAALAALGILSAALYALAAPVGAWFGSEPLACHPAVVGLLFALYLGALWLAGRRLAPTPRVLSVILGFAVLFRALMLTTPMYLSSDIYRYLWDGRVQWAGYNPYRYPPAAVELEALRDPRVHPHINRPGAVTAYPPGAQWLFALAARLAPGSIPGWRLVLLATDIGSLWVLLRLLPRVGAPRIAVLAYAWSPLVVFEGVQAGHVDLALILLVLLAVLARLDGSAVRAGMLLGIAVLIKVYPALLVAAWWRRHDWRFPAAVGATVALGYLPYAATLGVGALGFLPEYFLDRQEDFNLGLRALVTWGVGLSGEVPRRVTIILLLVGVGAAVAWIGRAHAGGRNTTWQAAGLAIGVWLVLGPFSVHPWYVMWMVPFLCVKPSPAWLYFSGAVVLSYTEYLVPSARLPWWAWLGEYGPLYALLAAGAWRRAIRPRAAPLAVRPT